MKDGYYLSTYFEISKLANIYCCGQRHDNCIALWKKENDDITLVHYWELERLSGLKQQKIAFFDVEHCETVMNELLAPHNITMSDIIEVWGVPQLNPNGNYLSTVRFPNMEYHNVCHLATAVFMDTDIFKHENILAFSVDGGPDNVVDLYESNEKVDHREKYPFICCYSQAGKMDMFPVYSPGLLWLCVANYYGMREGSLMALTSASESKAYFEYEVPLTINVTDMAELYKILDKIVSDIEQLTEADAGIKFNYFDPKFSEKENRMSMVMKYIQDMSYKIMDRNIELAIEKYGLKPEDTYLAMTGGFALNCPCNTYLMKKYHFKGFMAPPCVSDTGMAMGIGLYSFYQFTDGNFNFHLKNAYYGDSDDFEKFINKNEYAQYISKIDEIDYEQIVDDLERDVIVWFDGNAEVGPRALGARSILGDPRYQKTKDRLNEVKIRQWWRPVAPIVLADQIANWFDDKFESPYMLHASKIKDEKRDLVPAIVHFDGSARMQSIDSKTGNERLLKVIEAFYKRTGVPIICNTSLNDKGEPIINTIEEALNFALRKKIKVVYVNGKRVELKNFELYKEDKPLHRNLRMPIWKDAKEREEYIAKYRPAELDERNLILMLDFNTDSFNLENQSKHDLHRLNIFYRMQYKSANRFKQYHFDLMYEIDKRILGYYLRDDV